MKLLRMDDPQAPPIGTHGTVIGVDDSGSIILSRVEFDLVIQLFANSRGGGQY